MAVMYLHLKYEDYKNLERQMREFNETTHSTSGTAFYHKAVRIKVCEGLIMEFHGPLVGGPDQHESQR